MIACPAFDAVTPPDCLPAGVRSRLWLRGTWLGQRGEASYLWLHLHDGRVAAFRLPGEAFGDDGAVGELLGQVAEDRRGTLLEARFGDGIAVPLYAAPVALVARLPRGDAWQGAARAFAEGLDQEVLSLLTGLNRHRVWDSLRNYNRLAAIDPKLRERRLQALARFPLLVAPVLLSAHQRLDLAGGKRHAWRDHDDEVMAAVDLGRDLTGALARHYDISKALVRAPICASMWGGTALSHRRLLRLLDGIPGHRWPVSPAQFEPAMPLFIFVNLLADDTDDLRRLGRGAFREGLEAVCTPLQALYPALGPALADCQDFIRAAADWASGVHRSRRRVAPKRLALAWIETRGFRSLLAASRRWHAGPMDPGDLDGGRVPRDGSRIAALLGEHREGAAYGRELCTAAELAAEGTEMHHCVSQYWARCQDLGTRIFALGLGPERATAEYRFAMAEGRFSLAQLRGPYNAVASPAMAAFAGSIAARLNARERAPARADLVLTLGDRQSGQRRARRPARRLDRASRRELTAVLAQVQPPAVDGELLREYVAGYQFHGGIDLEPQMGVGDELDLAREPNNVHDVWAVAVRWRGEHIGYVPRRVNADIARRLDAGDRLICRLTRIDEQADTWERAEFTISQVAAQ